MNHAYSVSEKVLLAITHSNGWGQMISLPSVATAQEMEVALLQAAAAVKEAASAAGQHG